MNDLTDYLLDRVRELLRREPRFASMSRTDLDLHLADLEREYPARDRRRDRRRDCRGIARS